MDTDTVDTDTVDSDDMDGDGYSTVDGADCDDGDAGVNPGAVEVCDDGVDNDCDGGAGGCGPTSGSLSTAVEYVGEGEANYAGRSVAGAGDVNADGYDDIVVGASGNDDDGTGDNSAGAAYLVLGSAAPASVRLSSAVQYTGEASNDAAGVAVSGAGDVNGDGYDDVLVCANSNDDGGDRAGAAYLVLGSAAPASASLSTAVQYTGEAASDYAHPVASADDVNADGYDDILVGAYGNDGGGDYAGAAYLVLGSAAPAPASLSTVVTYIAEAPGDSAGYAVAGAGDVDGDGYDDLLIGAAFNSDGGSGAGATYLVRGSVAPASASLSSAVQYSGEAANEYAGTAVSGANDVDVDGYDDILMGAYLNDDGGLNAGAAYLILGSGL